MITLSQQQPVDLIDKLINNQHVFTNLTLLLGALLAYLITRVNKLKSQHELDIAQNTEILLSTKRVALRSEYLQIYNSTHFTNEQKWLMTRSLISAYEAINGNHYIHQLDDGLKVKMEERPHEIE